MAAFEWNSPSAGRFGRQIDRHVDAHRLGQVTEDRILLHATPLRPQPLRSIPKKGGLVGARGVDQFSGRSGSTLVRRLTISQMASIRAGPQAWG